MKPARCAAGSVRLPLDMKTQNLWAPWRMQYIESLKDGPPGSSSDAPAGRSFLLDYWEHPEKDDAHFVIERDAHGLILLNLYPFTNGHLLVCLGDPRPRLLDYEPPQRAALWSLVDRAVDLVERALNCQGVNVGINQGRAAGAGVPQHLHVHVVPRWAGDTNFITVVGEIRVIPAALETTFERFRAAAAAFPRR